MDSDFAVVRWTDHHDDASDRIVDRIRPTTCETTATVSAAATVTASRRRRHLRQHPCGTCNSCDGVIVGLRPALDRRRRLRRIGCGGLASSSTSATALWLWLVLSVSLVGFVSDVSAAAGARPDTRAAAIASAVEGPAVASDETDGRGHYTHTWAVHVPGGAEVADRIATEHGFVNMGKIVDDHYHFHHNHVQRRSLHPADDHHDRLTGDRRVHWARQQRAKSRQKRDFVRQRPSRTSMAAEVRMPLNDPKWPQMWYLNRGNGLDMNVIPAWREGITGKGVVVTILDDGLESDHPDLQANYDPKASYDVNSHDNDPMPHYDMTDSNRHGTRCAGEVAATANNSLCAVGIAYGSSVGGVRMLDGDVTDAVEARSLSLNPQHIDIYSASWGPDDDGKTVDGPGEMATRAFIEGVTKGRSGKGSIFVWASGNGGREHDNCNCDGYTNSIWTLSISSATEEGHVPWYSEKCSSTLATTYSSGGSGEKQIVTTDLHHTCTASHTGTSASAPLAAGIVALVLEANGNLTWRDLQHIVVRTAKPGNLKDPTWTKNGIGRRVSHSFGYGLMDAAAMVQLARKWKTVPEQQRCEINAPHLDTSIPPKSHKTLLLKVEHCKGVNYLEHVQAKITLTSQRRGDIEIYLLSPAGTRVTLLTSRTHDVSRSGFNQWPFMSVHTWGEAPHGSWLLEIRNEGRFMGHAALKGWSLIFYGTTQPIDKKDPVSVRLEPNSSLSASKYPIIVQPKPVFLPSNLGGPGKNNRKQQQQQQQQQQQKMPSPANVQTSSSSSSASSSSSPAPQRKQPKQPKNNAKNQSKNGGQSRSTTPRPPPLSNYNRYTPAERTRTYNLSEYLASLNAAVVVAATTHGPKLIANNVDVSYDKLSVKSPKQVKQIYAPLVLQPPTTTVRPPNIPKKFANYEKVQEIYPEFQAYEVPSRNATRSPSTTAADNVRLGGGGGGDGRGGGGGNGGGGGSGSATVLSGGGYAMSGKPSRENAKNLFFTDNGITMGKKNSSQIVLVRSPDNRSHANASARSSNRTAQITQWEMIFYGTESTAQPNDEELLRSHAASLGDVLGENTLDIEASDSDQWRDEHQIGESHVDVQRTASNDQTGSACRSFLPNKLCIECLQNTFLYEGRCYTACPERSYMVAEVATSSSHATVARLGVQPLSQPIVMRRRRRRQQSPPPPPPPPTATQKLCGACHYSCLKCRAPNDYDCTACAPDAQLTQRVANESYCLPIASTPASQTTPPTTVPLMAGNNTVASSDGNTSVAPYALAVAQIIIGIAIVATVCEILRKFTNVFSCWQSPGSMPSATAKPFEAYAYGKAAVDEAHDDDDDDDDEDDDEDDGDSDDAAANGDAMPVVVGQGIAMAFASDSEVEIPFAAKT